MTKKILYLAVVAVLLLSCKKNIQPEVYIEHIEKGNNIAMMAQAALLANVSAAMQSGGPAQAVVFCNLKASAITDSLNRVFQCSISRVSAKNRNAENGLATAADKKLWAVFANENINDTVVQKGKNLVYYKPIRTAMPACLKCHGTPGVDIDSTTTLKLQQLYPNDQAVGYALNDFRGLWKIEFSQH